MYYICLMGYAIDLFWNLIWWEDGKRCPSADKDQSLERNLSLVSDAEKISSVNRSAIMATSAHLQRFCRSILTPHPYSRAVPRREGMGSKRRSPYSAGAGDWGLGGGGWGGLGRLSTFYCAVLSLLSFGKKSLPQVTWCFRFRKAVVFDWTKQRRRRRRRSGRWFEWLTVV